MVDGMHLVLIGNPIIPVPDHPRIHHLGFVSDQDKFDALAAAELLIMPSYFESLSMVALEAWALAKPVLANGKCDVLRGQCIRSNGGLYYENFAEFLETLRAIDLGPALAAALGRNGREYFAKHYSWPIIDRKYLDMLDRLQREQPTQTIEPLPGWLAKRRKNLPPANDAVAALPMGPALEQVSRDQAPPAAREKGTAEVTSHRQPVTAAAPPPSPSPSSRIDPLPQDRPQPSRVQSSRHQSERRRPSPRPQRPTQSSGPPASSSGPRQGPRPARPDGHRGPRRRRRGGGPPRKPN
jgi:hypothetical protein